MKDDYKNNGNRRGSGSNGMPDVCISTQPEPNSSKSEAMAAANNLSDEAEALVESNNTSLSVGEK